MYFNTKFWEDAVMKKIFTFILLGALSAAPVFAAEISPASKGKLSKMEFSALAQNHGIQGRVLDWKYDAYRHGRLAVAV